VYSVIVGRGTLNRVCLVAIKQASFALATQYAEQGL